MAAQDMNTIRKPSLLGLLKTTVKKVLFIMKATKKPWRLAAAILACGHGRGRGVRALSSRRWSFNEGIGLMAIMRSPSDHDCSNSLTPYMTPSPDFSPELQNSRSFFTLQRSSSFPEEDDIDKESSLFIANFRRHLMLEREASLRLRNIIEANRRRYKSLP
ncbi:hypothetical protein Hanom_Chr06g00512751 [Helianthus anomalus]